jgi:hypothetical protein
MQNFFAIQPLATGRGAVTRRMSPSDLGRRLKPFVLLDLFDAKASSFPGFGCRYLTRSMVTITDPGTFSTSMPDWTFPRTMMPGGGIDGPS